MALHPDLPKSPFAIADPAHRWFPAEEQLREQGYAKLLPPLVAELRKKIKEWRDSGYGGSSTTSKALLRWWFQVDHPIQEAGGEVSLFRYFFAQREAVETIIWLFEVAQVKDKHDLMRFDSSGAVSTGMFEESWLRFVIKMATGSGKTKVLSLVVAWSYFHKLYEQDSGLARNFLIIAPNIIVLDRLRTDFDGLRIFSTDPVVPENGFEGKNWKSDFQPTLHIQDEVGPISANGNIFLTNIHRVYESSDEEASVGDADTSRYFLGPKPVGATQESKVDLGEIVRDIEELVVLNDEAHHIHDGRLAWFKAIEDIHNRLRMKGGQLALQVDVTATPKHENGSIFVQTVSDYPLVEAIYQDVVKHPVLPDLASRAKVQEHKSVKYTEKYKDFLHLGYLEWKKAYEEHGKIGKKAILFVMTEDTKSGDEVAEYLETTYPELNGGVLVIHTKRNGEISESVQGKKEEELKKLRKEANDIDKPESSYKAIVSVLMLKEGWDVRNVTTIVGLRPYAAKSNILPEQTLGRGLRRMYPSVDVTELLSVVGTAAFMDFVESIKTEGVELEYKPMGKGSQPKTPIVIEIDRENLSKDLERLEIEIPVLTPRVYREYKNLSELDISKFDHKRILLKQFSEAEQREIVFRDIASNEVTHTTEFDSNFVPDYQNVIGYFARVIMRELRLVSGYDILFGKVKEFIQQELFTEPINLEDPNSLRNLSEIEATRTVIGTLKRKINELTVRDKGEAEIREYIKVGKTRPFVVRERPSFVPTRSPFNRIVGDGQFELEFAKFLDDSEDVVSFVKNYFAVHFKIEYVNAAGDISYYYPDFFVKLSGKELYVVETKGREDLDDPLKIERLRQWATDVNALQNKVLYKVLYIKQERWDKVKTDLSTFANAVSAFGDES